MSAATLASIELALYTALSGLLTNVTTGPTNARPFACVGRYAGPVPPEGLAEAAAQYPCAMLRFDEDLSTRDVMGYGAASIEDRALSQFSVLVAVEDARADVQRFSRDVQCTRDLLEDFGGWFPQTALDLREVRIRHAGESGEIAYRLLRGFAALPNEVTEVDETLVHPVCLVTN